MANIGWTQNIWFSWNPVFPEWRTRSKFLALQDMIQYLPQNKQSSHKNTNKLNIYIAKSKKSVWYVHIYDMWSQVHKILVISYLISLLPPYFKLLNRVYKSLLVILHHLLSWFSEIIMPTQNKNVKGFLPFFSLT